MAFGMYDMNLIYEDLGKSMQQFTQNIPDKLGKYNEVHEILKTTLNFINVKFLSYFYLNEFNDLSTSPTTTN